MTCSFDGCGKPVNAKGLCMGHYLQDRQGKELRPLIVRAARGTTAGECSFEGCDKPISSVGLCKGHSSQHYTGKPLKPLRERAKADSQKGKECSVDGCDAAARTKGMCMTHYHRVRTHGTTDLPAKPPEEPKPPKPPRPLKTGGPCTFEGCEKPVRAKGLCKPHYEQQAAGKELKPLRAYGVHKPRKRKATLATEVRKWARENGIDVPAKGKIPWQVMEDWRNAQ